MPATSLPSTNPFDDLDSVERRTLLRHGSHELYELYLWSAPWRAVRAAALKRAGGACELCGQSFLVLLDVHHRTYRRLGAELLEDVMVLCRDCHDRIHGRL